MKVAFLSSEVEPFAKTGGLADVSGALPLALTEQDVDTTVFMPQYASVPVELIEKEGAWKYDDLPEIGSASFSKANLAQGLSVVLVESDRYFDRKGIYGNRQGDYPDNLERFAFFCLAVLGFLSKEEHRVDVIHCNDWQCGLVPVFLREKWKLYKPLARTPVLYTVHNLGYQGIFSSDHFPALNLPDSVLTPEKMEFFGQMNLLKGGLTYCDFITTVSETYSREIQTPEHGFQLEGVLQLRSGDLQGILNGIDTGVWNPETDPLIPARFSETDPSGKKVCKEALQKELGLDPDPEAPLLATISRLAGQKGIDLISSVLDEILMEGAQFALLGTGEWKYHDYFHRAAEKYPGRVSANLRYDSKLAHRIEAGADMFLMPSRYEPCGLNQMLSLTYGTIPIVRGTGGLEDTIQDFGQDQGKGNGFKFHEFESEVFLATIRRALNVFRDTKAWAELVVRALGSDFSWSRSARKYRSLYEKLMEKTGS